MRTARSLPLLFALGLSGLFAQKAGADNGVPVLSTSPDAGAPAGMTEDEAAPPEVPPEPEPVRPLTSKPASPEHATHVVAAGDTLGGIALKYGVSVSALVTANGITRDSKIRIGERLDIPAIGETAKTPERTHVVVSGNTLRSIAKSYGVSIDALREANHLHRSERLHIGQKLVVPSETADAPRTSAEPDERVDAASDRGMQQLSIAGTAPAYYFEPTGPGSHGMRPVIVYLHGRGAEPARYCQRWAHVARHLGWVICPSGPEDRGDGKRGWNNNWFAGRRIVMAAIDGLREKYGRRVQLYGNTLIGFSEGAFVAMNVGLREPHTFNRWLILGADADYWGAVGLASLPEARGRVRRVYLITGRHDDVYGDADEVKKWLEHAGVPVRVSTPKDMGHEVALDSKPAMYQAALRWLAQG